MLTVNLPSDSGLLYDTFPFSYKGDGVSTLQVIKNGSVVFSSSYQIAGELVLDLRDVIREYIMQHAPSTYFPRYRNPFTDFSLNATGVTSGSASSQLSLLDGGTAGMMPIATRQFMRQHILSHQGYVRSVPRLAEYGISVWPQQYLVCTCILFSDGTRVGTFKHDAHPGDIWTLNLTLTKIAAQCEVDADNVTSMHIVFENAAGMAVYPDMELYYTDADARTYAYVNSFGVVDYFVCTGKQKEQTTGEMGVGRYDIFNRETTRDITSSFVQNTGFLDSASAVAAKEFLRAKHRWALVDNGFRDIIITDLDLTVEKDDLSDTDFEYVFCDDSRNKFPAIPSYAGVDPVQLPYPEKLVAFFDTTPSLREIKDSVNGHSITMLTGTYEGLWQMPVLVPDVFDGNNQALWNSNIAYMGGHRWSDDYWSEEHLRNTQSTLCSNTLIAKRNIVSRSLIDALPMAVYNGLTQVEADNVRNFINKLMTKINQGADKTITIRLSDSDIPCDLSNLDMHVIVRDKHKRAVCSFCSKDGGIAINKTVAIIYLTSNHTRRLPAGVYDLEYVITQDGGSVTGELLKVFEINKLSNNGC
ncbi:MAG: hypothetical protein ACRDDZ_05805 [Marinifilaceae bacterium]